MSAMEVLAVALPIGQAMPAPGQADNGVVDVGRREGGLRQWLSRMGVTETLDAFGTVARGAPG